MEELDVLHDEEKDSFRELYQYILNAIENNEGRQKVKELKDSGEDTE